MKKVKRLETDIITEVHDFSATNKKEVADMKEDAQHCQEKGKKRKRKLNEIESDHVQDNTVIEINDNRGGQPENEKFKEKKKKKDKIESGFQEDTESVGSKAEKKKKRKKNREDEFKALNEEENTVADKQKEDKSKKTKKDDKRALNEKEKKGDINDGSMEGESVDKKKKNENKMLNEENVEAEEKKKENMKESKREKKKKKRMEDDTEVLKEKKESNIEAEENKESEKDKKKEIREGDLEMLDEENVEAEEKKESKREKKKKKKMKDDTEVLKEKEKSNIEAEENKEEEMKESKRDKKKKKKKMKEDTEVLKEKEESNIEAEENKEEEMMESKRDKKKKKKKMKDDTEVLKEKEESNIEAEENKEEKMMESKRDKKKKKKKKDDTEVSKEKETESDTDAGNVEGQSVDNKKKKKKKDSAKSSSGDGLAQSKDNDESQSKLEKRDGREHKRDKIKAGTKNGGLKTGKAASKPKRTASNEERAELTTPKRQSKKVKFSSQVEVFPIPAKGSESKSDKVRGKRTKAENSESKSDMVRGKRYTKAENEILKQAVLDYVKNHQLGPNGLDMVLNCKKHKEVKGCWKEIAEAIPYRPLESIYCRAQNILRRGEIRRWSKEEIAELKEMHAKHGADWKGAAQELGRYRVHVKDAYRRYRLEIEKRGHWSQDEYQTLFDLVNEDLEVKAYEEKKSKHGMLRDNISWRSISDQLGTRTDATCCVKWYDNLTSSMIKEGVWADVDDYRLLTELYNLDATCEEEVEWDCLIEDRDGEICRKRWHQMVHHIGEHGTKSFAEQVEVLSKRYCPRMLEIREQLDSRPVVD